MMGRRHGSWQGCIGRRKGESEESGAGPIGRAGPQKLTIPILDAL
jgi:hypothetical protein